MRQEFPNYAALAAAHAEGRDYHITTRQVPRARAVIVAPHGGKIEPRTSDIAQAIAGHEHSLYLFEGTMKDDNWELLHITSHNFDEPRCLDLVRAHEVVLAIHGCGNLDGAPDAIYFGGLDDAGKARIAEALRQAWFDARVKGHKFPGKEPNNICNRGSTGMGIQLEISRALRDFMDLNRFATAIRGALLP